jgi:hypothetical protein
MACWLIWRRMTLVISQSDVCWTALARRLARYRRWNIIEAIFLTGTTHALCNRWLRCTFRLSTAETWPDSFYVLGSGFRELIEARILPRRICDGLADTLGIPLEESTELRRAGDVNPLIQREAQNQGIDIPRSPGNTSEPSLRIDGNVLRSLERRIEGLERCPYQIGATRTLLQRLIEDSSAAVSEKSLLLHPELHWWLSAFVRSCTDHLQELQGLAAWSELPNPPPGFWDVGSPEELQRLAVLRSQLTALDEVPTLQEVAALTQTFDPLIDAILADFSAVNAQPPDNAITDKVVWLQAMQQALTKSSKLASTRIHSLEQIANQCSEFAEMDFDFLHNKSRDLFAIGFNVSENRIDRLLRSAGLRSSARQFCADRSGALQSGTLVRPRPTAYQRQRCSGIVELERFDV